ncbi:MAG: proline--tRNA ligase, partial [Candidatus Omnitrophica bacterium]|nr:proline--tRNA ligase [Candidatus Omnitrophota bacterium]
MFWSKSFIPTLKEVPEGAESVSNQLMLRAGLVRMLMAGVYTYLPLGLKVLNNIEEIIRQEMNATGAQELLLPA